MAKQFQVDSGGTLLTGLLYYWKMDGDSTDFYGSNNGTDTSMSYVTGKVGNAADFSGSNAHIFTAGDFAWTKLSISFWVKFDTLGAVDRILVSKTNSSISVGGDFEFEVAIYGGGGGVYITVNNAGLVNFNVSGNITTGTWYHIVATIDEDNDTAELWLNGVSKASTSSATQTHNNLTNGVAFGERRDGYGDLDGQMDEIGIWNKKLSSTEIADLYNSGSGQTMEDVAAAAVPVMTLLGVGT